MANYAVRIYDPALKAWLIAEAARRGPGVRTSDVVESALQLLKTSLDGSDAESPRVVLPEVSPTIEGGADAPGAGETPLPVQDASTAVTADAGDLRVVDPVQRLKGPDSGPDDELGF